MENEIMSSVVYQTNEGTPVTDSLKVASVFGKEHKHIIRDIKSLLGESNFGPTQKTLNEEQSDVVNPSLKEWFFEDSYSDQQGKKRPMYIMTRDGFTLLAMGMTGSKAMKFKIAFIEQFKKYESAVKSNTFGVPQSLSEALLMAANQAKQIEEQHRTICQQSSVIWLSEETIKKQKSLIKNQADKIEEMIPGDNFARAVLSSNQSILVGEMATILTQNGCVIGRDRLFTYLREHGYLHKMGEQRNLPVQRYTEMGLFEIKKQVISRPEGDNLIRNTTKITPKGQIYLYNKLMEGGRK